MTDSQAKLQDLNKPNMTTVEDNPDSYQQIFDQVMHPLTQN